MTTLSLLSVSSCIPVWDCFPPFTYNHVFCIRITVPQHSQGDFFRALNGPSSFKHHMRCGATRSWVPLAVYHCHG